MIEFISITTDPGVAQELWQLPMNTVMVDLEIVGKRDRRAARNTVTRGRHDAEVGGPVDASLSLGARGEPLDPVRGDPARARRRAVNWPVVLLPLTGPLSADWNSFQGDAKPEALRRYRVEPWGG